jgi:hypothetical protein
MVTSRGSCDSWSDAQTTMRESRDGTRCKEGVPPSPACSIIRPKESHLRAEAGRATTSHPLLREIPLLSHALPGLPLFGARSS